jgi:putative flippase GtrA
LSDVSDEMTSTFEFPALPASTSPRAVVAERRARIAAGVRHRGNWLQFLRFGIVGASGYVVNLTVFAACVHVLSIDYRLASPIAYLLSVVTNFWLNRHWTFRARAAHPGRQAAKFFIVSLAAYGVSYVTLLALVSSAGMDKVIAQAIAVIAGMPLQFVGQKLWSFRA